MTDEPNFTQEGVEANRATYWFPLLDEETTLPVPDARLVGMSEPWSTYKDVLRGEAPLPDEDALLEAADDIGYPVSLRSGSSSAKHHGLRAVKARDADELRRCAREVIEHHAMDFLGPNPASWMVRPWLDLAAEFTAFGYAGDPDHSEGLPIGPEWRVFATSDGSVPCSHFYWPTEAFRPGKTAPQNAAQRLDTMEAATEPVLDDLRPMAARAAKTLDRVPAWSVDFALTVDDEWVLIDVADARTSWHPETCGYHEFHRTPNRFDQAPNPEV